MSEKAADERAMAQRDISLEISGRLHDPTHIYIYMYMIHNMCVCSIYIFIHYVYKTLFAAAKITK